MSTTEVNPFCLLSVTHDVCFHPLLSFKDPVCQSFSYFDQWGLTSVLYVTQTARGRIRDVMENLVIQSTCHRKSVTL